MGRPGRGSWGRQVWQTSQGGKGGMAAAAAARQTRMPALPACTCTWDFIVLAHECCTCTDAWIRQQIADFFLPCLVLPTAAALLHPKPAVAALLLPKPAAAALLLPKPADRLHESQAYPLTVTWAEPKRSDTAAEQVRGQRLGGRSAFSVWLCYGTFPPQGGIMQPAARRTLRFPTGTSRSKGAGALINCAATGRILLSSIPFFSVLILF